MSETAKTGTGPSRQSGRFVRFGSAVGLANLGDGIAVVAWAWTASLLTRDPLWIALLPAAFRVPWVLFALPSGIMADRADRKRLIVLCDVIRACAYAVAGLLILMSLPLSDPSQNGVENMSLYAALLCLGFAIGCAEVARDNAAQAMLPAIVPPEGLERANGILGSIETVGNEMAGPAVGAFLIAFFLPSPFLVIALALSGAALLTASLSGSFKAAARQERAKSWRVELAEGLRFVIGHPMLRVLVLVTGFWNLFAEMAIIALVLHVQENLNSGATSYGLILAVGAVGGVVGGMVVTPLLKVFSKGTLAKWMNLAAAPLFLLIALAPGPILVAGAMFFFYLTGIVWDTVSVSYRQRVVPDGIRGRVNSVYRLFAWGMMPLGLVASGAIVNLTTDMLGRPTALTTPFFIAAAGVFIVACLSWRPLSRGFQ
ncbi:MFS transporter [Roseibacterium beibuensis]|uniref:MFS transporter n=1 Tax=[Roseibacterium] beibuensis TaxID=1193142 RepID=UPI00217ED841|nr:MFS transporter [Roseibacterium beibuensis]MCS6626855.1 MFS transporter [Roseibacterium beibuensis]